MSRGMVQVPGEMKEKIESMHGFFYQTTNYGVIGKLIDYYEASEKQKVKDREQRELDLQKQKETMINVGDMKSAFTNFRGIMQLSEKDALEFLLDHFDSSETISKSVVETYFARKI